MKKLSFILAIVCTTFAQAQLSMGKSTTDNKWTFGGYAGLGGSFGSERGTSLFLTPRAGYKITDHLEAGLNGNFTWRNSKYFSSTMIGIGPFMNYYFKRSAYASANYQHFFINRKHKPSNLKDSVNESALYIGGGYMQRLGANTYMQIGGMYNVLYKKNTSVFGSGFVPNVGIVFGL